MPPSKSYLKSLLYSLVVLILLLGVLFFSRSFIEKVVSNPLDYFNSTLSLTDIYFAAVFIALIVIAVLFSYIVYLLLGYKTRFDLEIWSATKDTALSKEQFKKLYESAPVPYILLDKQALIHNPNKAALRFFGVLPEEIEGKNIFSYIAGEDRGPAEKMFQYYKSDMPINRKEMDMVTKNGDVRSVQLSIFEMKNPGSFSTTGLAMIFDITEQKMLDKAKTEFVSLASHQLRTPLATTKWLTEMLVSGDIGELSQKQKEYLDKLHAANEDMVDLVDVLLNVSRIEMGSLSVEIKPTNVEELSESILNELAFLVDKKKIQVKKEYNGLLKDIKSDPKLLRIVIQNLVSNALKYTSTGGTITITFEETGSEKRIKVSDTGFGIPEGQQNRIFTKLFRADNVRGLTDSQGTGLGLYLVKSVVASIGGSINFVSEESKGSTFTITL